MTQRTSSVTDESVKLAQNELWRWGYKAPANVVAVVLDAARKAWLPALLAEQFERERLLQIEVEVVEHNLNLMSQSYLGEADKLHAMTVERDEALAEVARLREMLGERE